jgi:hypothetical protein
MADLQQIYSDVNTNPLASPRVAPQQFGQTPTIPKSSGLPGALNTSMQPNIAPVKKALPPVSTNLTPSNNVIPSTENLVSEEMKIGSQLTTANENLAKATAAQADAQAEGKAQVIQEYADKTHEAVDQKAKQLAKWEYPEMHPTETNIKELGGLFSVMSVIGLMLGGSGKLGAMNALGAMSGMMKGWQEGKQDLFKREKEKFDARFAEVKQIHADIENNFNEYMKLLSTDKEAAMYAREELVRKTGSSSILSAQIEKGKLADAAATIKSIKTSIEHVETGLRQTKANQETARHNRAEEEIQRDREGKTGAVQKSMTQRSVNALGGLVSAVEALQEFPAGTTTGILPNLTTKDGMINYVRNTVGRKISPKSADQMNTLFTGIGRNLASIEASGAATGLAELSKQMQSGVYINSGTDDPAKVAFKVADIRRIAEENIAPAISSGLMSPDQQKTAQELVNRIRRAIPFTVIDVIRASSKEGTQTIGESSRALVASKNKFASVEELESAYKSGRIKNGDPVMVGGSVGTYVAPDKE